MRKLILALIAVAGTAFAGPVPPSSCPNCVLSTDQPQNAQINIGTATIRGTLTVSTVNVTNFNVADLTVTNIIGSGSGLSSLNASALASGTVPSARVVGSYTGITTLGTISGGAWEGDVVAPEFGGTGKNWSNVAQGNIPYFSGLGLMTTLSPGAVNRVLQSGGAGANPSWTGAPTLLGTNITAIPLANLVTGGTLPTAIGVADASLTVVSGSKITGNISGNAANIVGTLAIGQLGAGNLAADIVAQTLNDIGTPAGTFGGPQQSAQVTVNAQGRVTNIAQFAIPILSSSAARVDAPNDWIYPQTSQSSWTYNAPLLVRSSVNASAFFGDGSGLTNVSASVAPNSIDTNKLTTDAVTTIKIINAAVDSNKLAADAVTTLKILNASVTGAKLAASSVDTAKMTTDAVTTSKILNGSVTTAKLAASSVDTTKIVDGSVTNAKLAANSVDTAKIATDAVSNSQIINGAITPAKLSIAYLPLTGGTLSGAIAVAGTSVTANAFFGDGSHLTGVSGSSFSGGGVANTTTFFSSVTVIGNMDVQGSDFHAERGFFGDTTTGFISSFTFAGDLAMADGGNLDLHGQGVLTARSSVTASGMFTDSLLAESQITAPLILGPTPSGIAAPFINMSAGSAGQDMAVTLGDANGGPSAGSISVTAGSGAPDSGSHGGAITFTTGNGRLHSTPRHGGNYTINIGDADTADQNGSFVVHPPVGADLTYFNGDLTGGSASFASSSVTANAFFGDGSHLTGISSGGGDGITFISTTTAGVAISSDVAVEVNTALPVSLKVANHGLGQPAVEVYAKIDGDPAVIKLGYYDLSDVLVQNASIQTNPQQAGTPVTFQHVDTNGGFLQLTDSKVVIGNGATSGHVDVEAGTITATGSISAPTYFGDGSNLTGISAGSPSGPDGAVQFNNSGSLGGQDELFWDSTNTRLGIGLAPAFNAAQANIESLQYTAVTTGGAGNGISIQYTAGATAGSEVVGVTASSISVQIEDGVSTAGDIAAAILGNGPASALVAASTYAVPGLVSYWTMDEGAGTTLFDSVGSLDASFPSGTFVTGISSNGIDGTGGGATVNPFSLDMNTSDWTILTWAKISGGQVGGAIFGNYDGNGGSGSGAIPGWFYFIYGTGQCIVDTSAIGTTSACTLPAADSTWHHVAMTYTHGFPDVLNIYFDGVLNVTQNVAVVGRIGGTNPLLIGDSGPVAFAPFNGSLDEFGVVNRALTQPEIAAVVASTIYATSPATPQTVAPAASPVYLTGGLTANGLPEAALHVNGSIKMTDGNEASGNVLVSDASGVASWQNPSALTGVVARGVQVKTKAELDAITPALGDAYYCSDCTVPYDLCTTTAATLSGFRAVLNSAINTITPGTLVPKGCGTDE